MFFWFIRIFTKYEFPIYLKVHVVHIPHENLIGPFSRNHFRPKVLLFNILYALADISPSPF